MARRTPAIGYQNFEDVITKEIFYVDKTHFIEEWWENKDQVTLIARPRRFGKTLNMSMLEQFFSIDYKGRGDLFEGLSIWEKEEYRNLQGSFPVISLTFANVKERNYGNAKTRICQIIAGLYDRNNFLLDSGLLTDAEQEFFRSVRIDMPEVTATIAVHKMSEYLFRYYHKKVIILLDEYDTPMQEAYVNGYWEEIVSFIRNMFNGTFKTNPYLERAVLTGITGVRFVTNLRSGLIACPAAICETNFYVGDTAYGESIFSDLDNLEVITTTSDKYACSFGFTEEEVFHALDESGLPEKKQEVKAWYDGFTFGSKTDIYNPWSVLNYLSEKKAGSYWANTSSNSLVGKLVREGSKNVKQSFEGLLNGETLRTPIDEQIIYNQLDNNEQAIWSLLLASGYLKVVSHEDLKEEPASGMIYMPEYELSFTNLEVRFMFQNMVREWFGKSMSDYHDFIRALLAGNVKEMNAYLNRVMLLSFSSFDTGKYPQPERFYHGFVLGLVASLSDRYMITSNRESGFGRYDVMLEPRTGEYDGIVMEFKVHDPQEESGLTETADAALAQIKEKNYAALIGKHIPEDRIRSYGFAFEGRKVFIKAG